jgi:hypothetical protein
VINLHIEVRSEGVIQWDVAEADTIKVGIMIIITAMEAGDSVYVI